VYLTLETGHMGIAAQIADILRRHNVKATFFAANVPTQSHDGSLGNAWGTWWSAMAAQGHEFASLTWDHVFWQGDIAGYRPLFRVKYTAGTFTGREFTFDPEKYCAQIDKAARRLEDFTGKKSLPLFRAPGAKASARVIAAANACGYAAVGWASAGLLGEGRLAPRFDAATGVQAVLRDIRAGDILSAELGTQTRKDEWLLNNLEPIIVGLKARGLCFETLRNHPAYMPWIASHPG
jgi:peptidoglycan/xylan/chitin deacetylase (PgdA/CDA1 family)